MMAKASNALILISSFKNKTPVKKAMGGIIKLSNDKNTGPLSSIILKNKILIHLNRQYIETLRNF